jgi:hypothetical protein
VKQGVEDKWHLLDWLSNLSMVTYAMTKVFPKKDLLHKVQYMLAIINRDYEDQASRRVTVSSYFVPTLYCSMSTRNAEACIMYLQADLPGTYRVSQHF